MALADLDAGWRSRGAPWGRLAAVLLLCLLWVAITSPVRKWLRSLVARPAGSDEHTTARHAWFAIGRQATWVPLPLLVGWLASELLATGNLTLSVAVFQAGVIASGALGLRAFARGLLVLTRDRAAANGFRRLIAFATSFTLVLGVPLAALLAIGYEALNPDLVDLLGRSFRAGLGLCALLALVRRNRLLRLLPADSREKFRARYGYAGLLLVVALVLILAADWIGFNRLAALGFSVVLGSFVTLVLGVAGGRSALAALNREIVDPDPESLRGPRQMFLLAELRFLVRLAAVAGVAWGLALSFGVEAADVAELRALRIWPVGVLATDSTAKVITVGNFFTAGLLMLLTYALGSFLRGMLDLFALALVGVDRGLRFSISSVVYYMVLLIGTLMTLSAMGLELNDMQWFLAAAGVGIGFGLQEIISNFVSGVIILFERPLKVGDVIEVGGQGGQVADISIRSTTVKTWNNHFVLVPNKEIITQRLINRTGSDPKVRLDLPIGVSYGSDLKQVREVLAEVAGRHGLILKRPEPMVVFLRHGESSLDFEVRVWVDIDDLLRVTNDLRHAIDAAFRRNGIEIPFPQRDLHVRTDDTRPAAATSPEAAGDEESAESPVPRLP